MHERREGLNEVDSHEGDFGTAGGVGSEEGVVEAVLLDVRVPPSRDVHHRFHAVADLLMVHCVDELCEKLVHVRDEGFVLRSEDVGFRVIDVGGGGGEDAVVLGVDEFEHAVHKIAQVVEEFVVRLRDKVVPLEFSVARFGAVGEEVESPD